MEKAENQNKGFTVVEVLIVLAIFGIFAGMYVRVFYGSRLRQWEDGIYKSLGLAPELVRFIIGSAFISFFFWKAIKARKQKRTRV